VSSVHVLVFYRCRSDQSLSLCIVVVPWLYQVSNRLLILLRFDCSVSLYFPPRRPQKSDSLPDFSDLAPFASSKSFFFVPSYLHVVVSS
jgi:hypothetical protein